MTANAEVGSALCADDAASGSKRILGPPLGERVALYMMSIFLGGWLISIIAIQGYLIVTTGVGSGLDGGGHVPHDIAQKYGTDNIQELMKATNLAKASDPKAQGSTLAEDAVVYARAIAILVALTAFWYFIVSRITPFPGAKDSISSSTPANSTLAVLSEYPRLQRFTLICDVILFAWIIVEGALIIPFMMIRYGLH